MHIEHYGGVLTTELLVENSEYSQHCRSRYQKRRLGEKSRGRGEWDTKEESVKKARVKSVSYTHLTLPTIVEWCRSRWSPYH